VLDAGVTQFALESGSMWFYEGHVSAVSSRAFVLHEPGTVDRFFTFRIGAAVTTAGKKAEAFFIKKINLNVKHAP
jgi:hypothetical protein